MKVFICGSFTRPALLQRWDCPVFTLSLDMGHVQALLQPHDHGSELEVKGVAARRDAQNRLSGANTSQTPAHRGVQRVQGGHFTGGDQTQVLHRLL